MVAQPGMQGEQRHFSQVARQFLDDPRLFLGREDVRPGLVFEVGAAQRRDRQQQGPVAVVAPIGGAEGEDLPDRCDLPADRPGAGAFVAALADAFDDDALVDVGHRHGAKEARPSLDGVGVAREAALVLGGEVAGGHVGERGRRA